jgi:hypothetical protein
MANIATPMSDKELQTSRANNYQLVQRSRPRGLVAQIMAVLLQPGVFFRTLPSIGETRQWLWVAVIVLALAGYSAVRYQELSEADNGGGELPPMDFGALPEGDLGFEGGGFAEVPPDAGGGGFPGEVPPDLGPTPGGSGGGDVSSTWTTALVSASGIVLGWFILTLLLIEVPLFNGKMPRLGQNFHIAVWATMPLALMAALQLAYYAAGGQPGEPGLAGLLSQWETYGQLPDFSKAVILSLAGKLTLFWLWSLALIYYGARYALRGRSWASLLVVILWVTVSVVTPVLTGAVKAPAEEMSETPLDGGMMEMPSGMEGEFFDPSMIPFGEGEEFPSEGDFSEIPGDAFEMSTAEAEVTEEFPEFSAGDLTEEAVLPDENRVETTPEAEAPVRPVQPPPEA